MIHVELEAGRREDAGLPDLVYDPGEREVTVLSLFLLGVGPDPEDAQASGDRVGRSHAGQVVEEADRPPGDREELVDLEPVGGARGRMGLAEERSAVLGTPLLLYVLGLGVRIEDA